ncbi:VOC family protein [Microcella flavibacter]|uniref:VOC family protein n=1 Tax=Microcella flavibacter TaxID=1804990 RepID=UPI0014564120|nr:VOC family protein [Microcella flavibacter]
MTRSEIVEIPVADLVQAAAFYSAVFDVDLVIETIGGLTMAFFPDEPGESGGAVALCQGDGYRPSGLGVRVFLRVDDVDAVLARALESGAQLVAEPADMPTWGRFAEFSDPEGTVVGIVQLETPAA